MLASGCALESADATSQAIVGGSIEHGHPEVVFIRNEVTGQNCTATIIAPRVALTAKHCVPTDPPTGLPDHPSRFRVQVGANADERTYRVSEVRAVPGSWDVFDGADVAVLILASPSHEPPRAVSFDDPSVLLGQSFKAVGYGQRPGGGSGVKYSTTNTVESIGETNIRVPPTICTGDSGGPFIGADGRVWGVVSYTFASDLAGLECGRARGAYNTLHQYRAFIERAIADAGGGGTDTCVAGPETCNGEDDDCDDLVDEGCAGDGELCEMDRECASGTCRALGEGPRRCATACNPLQPTSACGAGSYCAPSGPQSCDGYCHPGEAGALTNDAPCRDDVECASARCADPGDGRRRCVTPCGTSTACADGEVCTASAGACGVCAPEGTRPMNPTEPGCVGDECVDEPCAGDRCATPCAADECGDGFECVGGDAGSVCQPVATPPARSSGGCSCTTTPSPMGPVGPWLIAAFAALLSRRRVHGSAYPPPRRTVPAAPSHPRSPNRS